MGSAYQGHSVSLSSDGNTAIVGGPGDDGGKGAAWVYTRSGGVWTQKEKLVGTGAIGDSWQGDSVSLSSDGNTAIVGGPSDGGEIGAAWVYVRKKLHLKGRRGGEIRGDRPYGFDPRGKGVGHLVRNSASPRTQGRGDSASASVHDARGAEGGSESSQGPGELREGRGENASVHDARGAEGGSQSSQDPGELREGSGRSVCDNEEIGSATFAIGVANPQSEDPD